MALTLSGVRSRAQALLDEPGTAAISTTQWLAFINMANSEVWRLVVASNPTHHQVRTGITWPANTVTLDISGGSYLNAAVYKIAQVEWLSGGTTISTSNLPYKLIPMRYDERPRLLGGTGPLVSSLGTSRPTHYALTGTATLELAPIPTAACSLGITYIPSLTELTTSDDAVEVLGGKADDHHNAVVYRAAMLANAKRNGSNPVVADLWAEAKQRIAAEANARDTDEPWRIRRVRRGP